MKLEYESPIMEIYSFTTYAVMADCSDDVCIDDGGSCDLNCVVEDTCIIVVS